VTCKTSDVKAASMPMPLRERDRVPDTSRRLRGTESNIQETSVVYRTSVQQEEHSRVMASKSVVYSG